MTQRSSRLWPMISIATSAMSASRPAITPKVRLPEYPVGASDCRERSRAPIAGASGQRGIHTFTCMVRVYRREVLGACEPQRGGFLGVTEVLLRALAAGYRVVERPATLHRRRVGQSKMRVLQVGCAHLGLLWGNMARPPTAVRRADCRTGRHRESGVGRCAPHRAALSDDQAAIAYAMPLRAGASPARRPDSLAADRGHLG